MGLAFIQLASGPGSEFWANSGLALRELIVSILPDTTCNLACLEGLELSM